MALDFSPKRGGPTVDECAHGGIPPAGVLHERHGHRISELLIACAQRPVDEREASTKELVVALLERGEQKAPQVGCQQMEEDFAVVAQVLADDRSRSRAQLTKRLDEVAGGHRN